MSIFCLKKINDMVLRHVPGAVLILFSIYFWFFNKKIQLRPTMPHTDGHRRALQHHHGPRAYLS